MMAIRKTKFWKTTVIFPVGKFDEDNDEVVIQMEVKKVEVITRQQLDAGSYSTPYINRIQACDYNFESFFEREVSEVVITVNADKCWVILSVPFE
jgi:hypothetical protein